MQYFWANKKWNNFSASLLFLNNGFQKFNDDNIGDGTNDLQTFGTHLKTKLGNFALAANIYGQSGKNPAGAKIKSAYLASIDGSIKVGKTTLGLGFETISGKDLSSSDNAAFFPIFGTNHKFNGFMDYFYVGNHAYSQGLNDIHISATFPIGKAKLMAKVLHFSSAEKLASGKTELGTEIDLVLTYKVKPAVTLKAGYSQMFASDGMKELKNVSTPQNNQNWAWTMLVIKPKFL